MTVPIAKRNFTKFVQADKIHKWVIPEKIDRGNFCHPEGEG
jgi:hypothetical protein